MKVVKSSED